MILEFLKKIFLFNQQTPMIFTDFFFWGFFAVVLMVYVFIYKRIGLRNAFLLLVSIFFYYKTSGFYFFLLIFSTLVDYYIGNAIHKSDLKLKRKILITLSITINLFVLSYFKYSYLLIDSINYIFNTQIVVIDVFAKWTNSFAGTHFSIDKIILPVGISFYTFQTISYSVDIYRRKIEPVKNILDFGFFVSFFPQLVAGPIVRASDFIPQIYEKFNLTKKEFGLAVFLILNGLLKKMFISDYIAVNFIDRIFSNPIMYTGFENLMSLYAYSIQVYCDFSGYTDIAIGVALLMGFRLNINFNSPYKATTVAEFWQRWHISLSTWLKDYLYIPLGGNKHGEIRTNINLMITMLLGGLWHGASWQFVIWGGLNGLGLVFYKYWKKISPFTKSKHWLVRFYGIFLTFNFISITRIWFRSDTLQTANNLIHQILHEFNFSQIAEVTLGYWKIFSVMLFAMIIHWLPTNIKDWYKNLFISMPNFAKIIIIIISVFVIYQVRSADIQPFIYFQF